MTLQTILIADDPQRFRFRVGDRVAVRDPEGYADLGHSGIVTDGTLTENTPTGAYQTVYRVRGADEQTFAAREVDLLRVFNEASLREEIRARLRRAFSAPAVRVVVTRRLHRLHFVYTPVEGTSVEHVTCLKNSQLGIDPWKAG